MRNLRAAECHIRLAPCIHAQVLPAAAAAVLQLERCSQSGARQATERVSPASGLGGGHVRRLAMCGLWEMGRASGDQAGAKPPRGAPPRGAATVCSMVCTPCSHTRRLAPATASGRRRRCPPRPLTLFRSLQVDSEAQAAAVSKYKAMMSSMQEASRRDAASHFAHCRARDNRGRRHGVLLLQAYAL